MSLEPEFPQNILVDVPTAIFQLFSSREVKEGEGWHKSCWHRHPRGESPKTVTPQNWERGSYHGNSQLLGKGKIQRGDPAEQLEAERIAKGLLDISLSGRNSREKTSQNIWAKLKFPDSLQEGAAEPRGCSRLL